MAESKFSNIWMSGFLGKKFESEKKVNFFLNVTQTTKDPNTNEWVKSRTSLQCKAFKDNMALIKTIPEGSIIKVSGQLHEETFANREGVVQTVHIIYLDDVKVLKKKDVDASAAS